MHISSQEYQQFLMRLLQVMLDKKASDLFLSVGSPPMVRINGKLSALSPQILSAQQIEALAHSIMNPQQMTRYQSGHDCNFTISLFDGERFRFNVFRQKTTSAMVIRHIQVVIPTLEELKLPLVLKDLISKKAGLILVCGGTGVGKSTSLAAMINHRNQTDEGHIVCIEDPIEFVHQSQASLVTQREIDTDVESWEQGIISALRQSPDVIMLGEMRSSESMHQLLQASTTGHLCITTLHAHNVSQAFERVLQFFDTRENKQTLLQLSESLVAILVQRLVPRQDGKGREAAIELMLNTPVIADAIAHHKIEKVAGYMALSNDQGMITMDQSLLKLFDEGVISLKTAMQYATSQGNLRNLIQTTSKFADRYQKLMKESVAQMEMADKNLVEQAILEAQKLQIETSHQKATPKKGWFSSQ